MYVNFSGLRYLESTMVCDRDLFWASVPWEDGIVTFSRLLYHGRTFCNCNIFGLLFPERICSMYVTFFWTPVPSEDCVLRLLPLMGSGTKGGLCSVTDAFNGLWSQRILIVLGFNDTSTLEGHFVSSPREREKRDRRESRGDEREGQGRKRNNGSKGGLCSVRIVFCDCCL